MVGWGETVLHYASLGTVTDEAVTRVIGQPAAAHMWADDLGGMQMALFDAVGKATGASVSALLGKKIRDWVPISWWSIDAPPEDWAAEGGINACMDDACCPAPLPLAAPAPRPTRTPAPSIPPHTHRARHTTPRCTGQLSLIVTAGAAPLRSRGGCARLHHDEAQAAAVVRCCRAGPPLHSMQRTPPWHSPHQECSTTHSTPPCEPLHQHSTVHSAPVQPLDQGTLQSCSSSLRGSHSVQVEAIADAVPPHFKLDLDANATWQVWIAP